MGAPIYEFGFVLSWGEFKYSQLNVQKHNVGPYRPTAGKTIKAPKFGNFSTDLKDYYAFPKNIRYIY